jgi:hypothetical protein
MKRTKHTSIQTNEQLQTLASELVTRASIAAKLGQQYSGKRDLYEALGYKTTLIYSDYLTQYCRQDIAKAIIDKPCKGTWKGDILIRENKDDNETALEKAWTDLVDVLHLKDKFQRVDRLAGLGKYGILLLGLSDVRTTEDWIKPVSSSKLKYVKPFGEGTAIIQTYESDTSNERFGMPLIYSISIQDAVNGTSSVISVHYSRIIHIVDDILESEIEGFPRLEPVFNRLMDIEKIVGGDGEMFWRNARPGFAGKLDDNFQITPAAKKDINDQIEEYDHNLKRILINTGLDLKPLSQPVHDPKNHVDVQIQMISAQTSIPKRVLTGSERGELSSSQDADEWKTFLQDRRESHAEIRILRPFIDRMIEFKILPKPSTGKYVIQWSDLFAMSEKERTEIGKNRSTAIKDYVANPVAEAIFPPKAFMQFCLGLDEDQIELVDEMVGAGMTEEQIAQLLNPEPAQPDPNQPDNTNPQITE